MGGCSLVCTVPKKEKNKRNDKKVIRGNEDHNCRRAPSKQFSLTTPRSSSICRLSRLRLHYFIVPSSPFDPRPSLSLTSSTRHLHFLLRSSQPPYYIYMYRERDDFTSRSTLSESVVSVFILQWR